MRIALFVFISLIFLACGNPQPNNETFPHAKSYPVWYEKVELFPHAKSEVLGFGNGDSLALAKAKAKEAIALGLVSKIDSSLTILEDDESSKNVARLKVSTKLELSDLKVLKREKKDGLYFVVLSYDNLDFAQKVKAKLKISTCQDEDVSSYLSQTLLYKKLSQTLGCKLNFKLHRQNKAWYLEYKKDMFLLSSDEFEELFVSVKNEKLEILPSKKVLADGDSFYFRFVSKKEGYITLLNVYENGIVTLLKPSTKIGKYLQIPSKDSAEYFEAGVIKEGADTYDLYVAVWSEQPLDYSRYIYATDDLASSELAYKFDELIQKIDKYEYSTVLIRTKARK